MKKASITFFKIIKKILFGIIYLLLGIYIAVLIPMFWGDTPLVVLTGSMSPTFKVGDIVYYEKINPTKFEKNDILVWNANESTLITHRIVDINEDFEFTTKGDANNSIDNEKVHLEQVLGRAKTYKIPVLGHYVNIVNKHPFVVYILVAIILIDYIIQSIYYKSSKNSNKIVYDSKDIF